MPAVTSWGPYQFTSANTTAEKDNVADAPFPAQNPLTRAVRIMKLGIFGAVLTSAKIYVDDYQIMEITEEQAAAYDKEKLEDVDILWPEGSVVRLDVTGSGSGNLVWHLGGIQAVA